MGRKKGYFKNLKNKKANKNKNTTSLLDLNDDCFLMIFKHLEFDDQINLSSICPRLENVLELLYKTTKSLNYSHCSDDDLDLDIEELNLDKEQLDKEQLDRLKSLNDLKKKRNKTKNYCVDYGKILSKIGQYLEKIDCFYSDSNYEYFSQFIHHVTENCTKLSELDIQLNGDEENASKKVLNKIGKLKTLKRLELKGGIKKELSFLSKLSDLEHLDLTECELKGINLDKLFNLKTLILEKCRELDQTHFLKLIFNSRNIKELNIRDCNFDLRAVIAIVHLLKDLEILTICLETIQHQPGLIVPIQKLKSLTLYQVDDQYERDYSNDNGLDFFLNELAKGKNDLEILKIIYNDRRVKDVTGEALIHFNKLKRLDIVYSKLSDDFIENVIKLDNLKTVYLSGCNMNKSQVLRLIENAQNISFLDITHIKDECNEELIENIIDILKNQKRPYPLEIRCVKKDDDDDEDHIGELLKNDLKCLKGNGHLLKMNQDWNFDYEQEIDDNDIFGYDSDDSNYIKGLLLGAASGWANYNDATSDDDDDDDEHYYAFGGFR